MAQIAIPLVIAGVLYLVSNDKKKENFKVSPADYNETDDGDKTVKNNADYTSLQMNNQGVYSQYQDKYIGRPLKSTGFTSLTGEQMNKVQHNNMNLFYNNKSNGQFSQPDFNKNESKLDIYTGAGSNIIEKQEISSFFKPHENSQNVYGNQNQSDFIQSRVVQSQRFANTTPWEQVREAPGTTGFNSAVENRDKWMPKKVDELRAENNPKSNYELNYVAPAFKMGEQAPLGKIIIKGPEKYHVNGTNGMGVPLGNLKPTQSAEQMLTDENREHTSVSYYGTRASDTAGYVAGKYVDPHKQQLTANPYLNLTSNQVYPTNEQNYGKTGYKSYTNNRDTNDEYFGAVGGLFMANVVNPIVNGLKHTKKTNFVENKQMGNIGGNIKPPVLNDVSPAPTNRQMQVDRVGLNYLQVNRQTSDGYITANPYLIGTQRESTSQTNIGVATGLSGGKSYQAEYNQRSFEKPSENRMNMGNTNMFNNIMNVNITKTEQCNDRRTNSYIPSIPQMNQLGENTTRKQDYKNNADEYLQADLLKAFKANPYTKSLNSVA